MIDPHLLITELFPGCNIREAVDGSVGVHTPTGFIYFNMSDTTVRVLLIPDDPMIQAVTRIFDLGDPKFFDNIKCLVETYGRD